MSKPIESVAREVADHQAREAVRAGQNAKSVRGARLMLATVTEVLTGGLVEVDGDMEVRRLAGYTPTVADIVVLGDFGNGNYIVFGKLAS